MADDCTITNHSSFWEFHCISHNQKMMQELQNMRLENESTDIVLICGDTKFAAHKLVLMASSPMLNMMLSSETAACKLELKISEVAMKIVLDFMYSRSSEHINFKNIAEAIDLLKVADFLKIEYLFQFCCSKISHMAKAIDFPLIATLETNEKHELQELIDDLVDNFVTQYCNKILDGDLYLLHDYNTLKIFVEKVCANHLATSENIVAKLMKWVRKNEDTFSEYASDLIGLVHAEDLYGLFIDSIVKENLLKVKPEFLLKALGVLPSYNRHRIPSITKSSDVSIIHMARMFQFKVVDGKTVCLECSFETNDTRSHVRYLDVPFKLCTEMHSFLYNDQLHIVAGDKTKSSDGKSFLYSFIKYNIKANTVQFLSSIELSQKLQNVVNCNNNMFLIEEYNSIIAADVCSKCHLNKSVCMCVCPSCGVRYQSCRCTKYTSSGVKGNENRTVVHCYDLSGQATRKSAVIAHHLNACSCFGSEDSLIVARGGEKCSFGQIINIVQIEGLKIPAGWSGYFAPVLKNFSLPFVFNPSQAVSHKNQMYVFFKDAMYTYDPLTNSVQSKPSGIMVTDNDVFFPLNECKNCFCVVVRRPLSENEYSYKLWKVGENKFMAEIILEKNAVFEVAAFCA